jgi:hypothetical protein
MNNEQRIANYIKDKEGKSEACLTFRQKRRIRKHAKLEAPRRTVNKKQYNILSDQEQSEYRTEVLSDLYAGTA